MKKYLSLFFCIIIVMLSCVTASAAQVVKFNINLVSETDSEAVITFDYEGGVSFSGLDFEVNVNTEKIKITESKAGEGYKNFLLQGNTAIFQAKSDKNPAVVGMACIPGFRVVDGKDLFTFKIKKLTADAIETDDFVVTITNCTDDGDGFDNFNQLTPSVTTDLKPSASQPTQSVPDDTTTEASSTTSEAPELTNGTAPDSEFENIETEPTENDNETDNKPNKTGFIIAGVVGVVVIAGIGTAVVLIRKKKTETEAEAERGNDNGFVQ